MRNDPPIHIALQFMPDARPKLEVPIKSMTISFKRPDWYAAGSRTLPSPALFAGGATAAEAAEPPPRRHLQQLQSFREMGSVLYIAAHPDD